MKYWQSGTGQDAMYARAQDDGVTEFYDDELQAWTRSDPLASEVLYSGDWVPVSADDVAAARAGAVLTA